MGRNGLPGLLALASACFVSVTSEYLPITALPQIAADFGVSEGTAGLLVTGYAFVVAATVVPLVVATRRWDRRTAVCVAIVLIVVSNVALALTSHVAGAVLARVVAAVGHGAFWSIVAPMAARISGRRSAGQATAIVFAGNALAGLVGLPATAAVATAAGWRAAAVVLAVIAALSLAAVLITTSPQQPDADHAVAAPAQIRRALTDAPLVRVNATTLVVVLAHFSTYTYVTVMMTRLAGARGPEVAQLLLVSGVVGLVALVVLGRRFDRHPRATALLVAVGLAVCMTALVTVGHLSTTVSAAAIVAWAIPAALMPVVLQAGVLRCNPSSPDIASSIYVAAYQIGIGGGAVLGAALVETSLDVALVLGAAAAAVGVVLVLRTPAFASSAVPVSTRTTSTTSSAGGETT